MAKTRDKPQDPVVTADRQFKQAMPRDCDLAGVVESTGLPYQVTHLVTTGYHHGMVYAFAVRGSRAAVLPIARYAFAVRGSRAAVLPIARYVLAECRLDSLAGVFWSDIVRSLD